MSIGFSFTGTVKKPDTLLAQARKLAEESKYSFFPWEEQGEAGVTLSLCPLEGRLYVKWKKEGGLFRPYTVEGTCTTTPAGPGLHKAAVELLDGLGIQKLRVEDETEYYQHRDFARMCREHFYPWLTTLVEVCGREDMVGMRLCWDLDQYSPEDIPGTVVTPVGRFSVEWLKNTLAQKGVEALAERFFLWYHPGRQDALFDRAVALNLLWELCYYVPSSRSEEDASIHRTICEHLEMAARLDPALPLPRQAYQEICQLSGRTPALPDGPELEDEFQPGFRKGLVTYSIGPLCLTLPGAYKFDWEDWDENSGCHRWADQSSHSPIWRVSGYKIRQGEAAFTPVLNNDRDLTEFEIKGGAVRWGWREQRDEEQGRPYYQVRAEVITGPSLFVITVTHLWEEERSGIVELLEKISIHTQEVEKRTIQADSADSPNSITSEK